MNILIRNTVWNHTVRYLLIMKYYLKGHYKNEFSEYYWINKRFYTKRQEKQWQKMFDATMNQFFKGLLLQTNEYSPQELNKIFD